MKLSAIHRYPVKGLRAEQVEAARLAPGRGIPYDRAFAFTSGNRPPPTDATGWWPSLTYLQMTAYPALARFAAEVDEAGGRLTVTGPDGDAAVTGLADPGADDGLVGLMERHFTAGPLGPITLRRRAGDDGHWDFTDTAVSICNLATVRWLEAAAGAAVSPLRFRPNLIVDGLEAWAEFGLPGRRLRIGEAELVALRPAMRCAATKADPLSGDTDLDVPGLLTGRLGHLYCCVYARVVEPGRIAAGDRIEDLGPAGIDPSRDLPPHTPEPRTWPRAAVLSRRGGTATLAAALPGWRFDGASPGARLKLHPGLGHGGAPATLTITGTGRGDGVEVDGAALAGLADGAHVIVSGPWPARGG